MLPSSWKRDVASGLVVLIPVIVTAYVVAFIFQRLADLPFLQTTLPDNPGLRVLVTLVIFTLLVLSVGYLMRTAVGDYVEGLLDDVMNRIPLLRVVYNASKMAVETALTGTDELQKPVKITTWHGHRMTAFKTGKTTPDGREVLFLPTSPNITTGFVVEVEPGEYTETDESVEDALTRVLSAGFGESRSKSVPIDVVEEDE
ncbi:DUF502 domain-containing protein [Natronomonas sp. EA1]|uniref:DUF502 domain-containing protein n=1 Tax=Natronomonas sp. EA1 TaxID=3421655 RepID=UPI003EBDDFB6